MIKKGVIMNLKNNKQPAKKKQSFWSCFLKKNNVQKIKMGFPLSRNGLFTKKSHIKQTPRVLKIKPLLLNKKGQGLIEYLILIALMGVATIGIIRTLNQTVKSRFANAIYALQGKNQKAKTHTMKKEEYKRSDLSDFMSGSASTDKKTKKRK